MNNYKQLQHIIPQRYENQLLYHEWSVYLEIVQYHVKFGVLTAVLMSIQVFWDITPCVQENSFQLF